MIVKGDSGWHLFRKTPLFELLTSALIIAVHILAVPKLRIVSDALFLEGVALSVIGSLVACGTSNYPTFHSPSKKGDRTSSRQQAPIRLGSLRPLLRRENGYRVLFMGLILVGAAVVIGELFARPAG